MLRVGDHRELQAVVLAMKAMDRGLAKEIRRATVSTMNPVWRGEVQAHARTGMDDRVIAKGARIKGGNPPEAIAASSRRALSGGLVPVEGWPAFEFGTTNRLRRTTYRRRNRKSGGTHTVTRRASRQLPARNAKGRVGYAAFAEVGPRMVALWVQLVVKKVHDALEGR